MRPSKRDADKRDKSVKNDSAPRLQSADRQTERDPAGIRLRLLGSFELGNAGRLPKKTQALLAYLAMHMGQFIARDQLAALCWSYCGAEQARQNLRQSLSRARAGLGAAAGHWLETSALGVRLVSLDTHEIDVQRFEALSRSESASDLSLAASLYRGELLAGLDIRSEPFEEWLAAERARLRSLACDVLLRLATASREQGNLDNAITAAQRLLSMDPLREDGHRMLIKLYAACGRRSEAVRQFETCREVLHRELGVEPDAETVEVAAALRQQTIASGNNRRTGNEALHFADPTTTAAHRSSPAPHAARGLGISRTAALVVTMLLIGLAGFVGLTRLSLPRDNQGERRASIKMRECRRICDAGRA
jgi:DNA-binding SARP family transcriptional activator